MDSLTLFNSDGIEIYIDTATGETSCTVAGYARMSEKDRSVIQKRLKGCASNAVKTVEMQTTKGLQRCALISEDLIVSWLPKDNPAMATKLLKLGVRHFMHELAGYKVTSDAIKPTSQAELILLLAQQNVEIERRLNEQQAKIDYFSEKLEAQEKWLSGIDSEIDRLNSPEGHYYTIIGFANLQNIQIGKELANILGRKASAYCRKNGLRKEEISDSMFGKVGCYPVEALTFIFTASGLL